MPEGLIFQTEMGKINVASSLGTADGPAATFSLEFTGPTDWTAMVRATSVFCFFFSRADSSSGFLRLGAMTRSARGGDSTPESKATAFKRCVEKGL